jgi:hypothetical protein
VFTAGGFPSIAGMGKFGVPGVGGRLSVGGICNVLPFVVTSPSVSSGVEGGSLGKNAGTGTGGGNGLGRLKGRR